MDPALRQLAARASTRDALRVAWPGEVLRADDVMRASGMRRSTTLQALNALVRLGLMEETAGQRPSSPIMGRPARWFRVRAAGGALVGVDAGHYSVVATVTDLRGEVLTTATQEIDDSRPPYQQAPQRRVAVARQVVRRAIAEAGLSASEVVALGIGVPAPVDDAGTTAEGWNGFWRCMHANLAEEFRQDFPHVRIENDASLAAIAERTWGAARGEKHFVALLATWALGAGVVLDGRLVRGRHGGVGELGFLSLVPRIGDSVGIQSFLMERITASISQGQVPQGHPWRRLAVDPMTITGLLATLRADDPVSAPLLAEVTARLTTLFGLLAKVYDPAMIVVCGPIVEDLERILDQVRIEFADLTDLPAPAVLGSRLGGDVVSLGAVAAARELAGEVVIDWALGRAMSEISDE